MHINNGVVIKLFKGLEGFDMCRSEYLLYIIINNYINYKLIFFHKPNIISRKIENLIIYKIKLFDYK